MESGWMGGACCKRAATLDYSSDAKPAQPSERTRPAAAFDERDRGAAWVGDMRGAPNGRNATANLETNELAAGEIRLILNLLLSYQKPGTYKIPGSFGVTGKVSGFGFPRPDLLDCCQ